MMGVEGIHLRRSDGRVSNAEEPELRPDGTAGFSEPAPRSIGELFAAVSSQMSALIRGEIELAQVNMKDKVARLGVGGAMLAVAGVLSLYLITMLLHAIAWAFGSIMPMWAAFLVVSAILLLVIAVLAIVGIGAIKKSQDFKVAPAEGIKKSIDAAKMGFSSEQ